MTTIAKSLIIFFIFNIFCGPCKADAEYDKQVTAELSWIWGQLKSVMTPEDKNVERTVKLSYLSSELDVMKVRLSKTGELQFSFGAHVSAQEACTMSEYVRLLSTPNVNRMHLLQGYDSYLSNASDFGAFFLDARNYLRRVDGNTDYSALFEKVDGGIEVSACRTGLIAFLLAHEFAHAVSGDPVAMESLPADQVNILEQNADSRALELLARLKTFPIIGVSQFYLMVNHLMHEPAESKYSSFDHPLPFSRLVTALNFSIDNFEKHLDTKDRESLGISVAVLTTAMKGMRDQVLQWDKVQQKFIATSAKDDGLRSFLKMTLRMRFVFRTYIWKGVTDQMLILCAPGHILSSQHR